MGGGERLRNFFSRQFPIHRREKACRVRLASRLFYAHSVFLQSGFEEFFFLFCARSAFCGNEFGAPNFFSKFCGKEFGAQNSFKRKNNGKNSQKICFRLFVGKNLVQKILSRHFARTNFVHKIHPNEKITAKMHARFFPEVFREGIFRAGFVFTSF